MKATNIRSAVGRLVFNHLVTPPDHENSQLVFHGGDYGHGYLYEEIFCRDDSDLRAAMALLRNVKGPVLDLAGGAGRLSVKLAQFGREVALVDKSVTMLELARRRKKKLSHSVSQNWKIYPQDITQLQIGREFPTIFSINNGLEHLKSDEAILQALLRVRNHLSEKGNFYIDVHYPAFWENTPNWKQAQWEYGQDFRLGNERYRVWGRTRRGEKSTEVIWEHAVTQNLFDYSFLKTHLNLLPLKHWHSLIEQAGFKVAHIWGSWAQEKIDASRPKMIFHVTR